MSATTLSNDNALLSLSRGVGVSRVQGMVLWWLGLMSDMGIHFYSFCCFGDAFTNDDVIAMESELLCC